MTNLTDAEIAKLVTEMTGRLRPESKFSLLMFLQAVGNEAGGTLVMQANCKSTKRAHVDASFQTERFQFVIPGQRNSQEV